MSDWTIYKNGYYTENDSAKVARDLHWSPESVARLEQMGPFLAIPYFDRNGKRTSYIRCKPDHPRKSKDENGVQRIVKYEAPKGVSTPPYFPKSVVVAFDLDATTLYVTEGEKKAAKATQEGFPCIGLPGVTNWSKPRRKNKAGKPVGQRRLNDELAAIPWKNRRVVITYDTDEKRNPHVNREAAELAKALESYGATVFIVSLPTCWNEDRKQFEKQGLDDFLVRFDREAYQRLVDDAIHR